MTAHDHSMDLEPNRMRKPNKSWLTSAAGCLLVIVPALLACGQREPKPGVKETVTAYETDGTTVIKFEPCSKIGASYNYPACGKLLRDEIAATMCSRGPGTHAWMYQIGATSPMPQTTYCK